MARLVFTPVTGNQDDIDRIFDMGRTNAMSPLTAQIRDQMFQMRPHDTVEIHIHVDDGEEMSEEEMLALVLKIRATISSTAALLKWPYLPGGKRRAYQTAVGVNQENGKTYIFLRRLSDPSTTKHNHIDV